MTGYRNISSIVVSFVNRDGVPTALVIDGTVPDADLLADVTVDEDGMTAAIAITGSVPNSIGYNFKSLEDWKLAWRRNEDPFEGQVVAVATGKPAPQPLGKVGQAILTVVALAILAPFVGILWAWAGDVFRSFS